MSKTFISRPLLSIKSSNKAPTGIEGFDEMTLGGLPRGRSTLIMGGPGTGKTVFSLQVLANGANFFNEPGIFVAFEENSKRILSNTAPFGWNLPKLISNKLFFLDAQPSSDLIQSGDFDFNGMLAILDSKAHKMGARRIVFDSLDILLNMLEPAAQQREANRLNQWIMEKNMTTILTGKVEVEPDSHSTRQKNGFMPFMVDSVVELKHKVIEGVSQRGIRVTKYRGSSFSENESPYVIGSKGFEIASVQSSFDTSIKVTNERVSSGVERLDTMLGGGYYRGSSILITGSPGTAKTTLSGSFAKASCIRGERTLFVSFDSAPAEIVRNLESVNIRLKPFERKRMLRIESARSGSFNSEIHFLRIKNFAQEHRARCLVIDPVSALGKQGNELIAHSVVERMVDWAKQKGMSLLCTSLLDGKAHETEASSIQISTIADTWIHLNYLVNSGERNRALTIVKSRGTSHSNQVRELVLKKSGITLADVYTVGGEVFMGTLRWEKEQAKLLEEKMKEAEGERKISSLGYNEAEIRAKLAVLQKELEAIHLEQEAFLFMGDQRKSEYKNHINRVGKLRGADLITSPSRRRRK